MGNDQSKPASPTTTTTDNNKPQEVGKTAEAKQSTGHRKTLSRSQTQQGGGSRFEHIRRKGSLQSPANNRTISLGACEMGNTQSSEKQPERDRIEPRKKDKEKKVEPPASAPAPVEIPASPQAIRSRPTGRTPRDTESTEIDFVPPTSTPFPHPPRLPLPIQDQLYTPGSPVLSPDDLADALHQGHVHLPHTTSLLSHTTLDDDEEVDLLEQANKGMTVPTILEWKQPGNKVYITGTFTNWSKKYRMIRDPDTGTLYASLDLPPGTHHVKFIVDGDMQLSKDLPTAVDFANVLVNYIEVSADDIPHDKENDEVPSGVHPPMVLPAGATELEHEEDGDEKAEQPEESKFIYTKGIRYGNSMPQYLLDLDRPSESHRYQRAENHLADIPTPPSLPMILNKSILNGALPMRDDISVLNLPNHTVLNHVATSSIKNNVLATSITTRYKAKYVTSIIYRATTGDD